MLSFNNDFEIKEKYINKIIKIKNYDYKNYSTRLGIPMWMFILKNRIIKNLSIIKSIHFNDLFLKSIPVGISLEKIEYKLGIIIMNNLIKIQNKLLNKNNNTEISLKIINLINEVKNCHEIKLEFNKNPHLQTFEKNRSFFSKLNLLESNLFETKEYFYKKISSSLSLALSSALYSLIHLNKYSSVFSIALSCESASFSEYEEIKKGKYIEESLLSFEKQSENLIELLNNCK